MNKHQRALRAARAAKRVPIVPTVVVGSRVFSAAAEAGLSTSNLTNMSTWHQFFSKLARNFTGYDLTTGQFNGGEAIATYAPLLVYAVVKRTGVAKPISRVLGRFGLRF